GVGLARGAGRTLGEVGVEQTLDGVRGVLEVHQTLYVPGVVDAWMGRVLADEGLGGVGGRFALAGTVIYVDEIEPRLARLVGEREARGQTLVGLDGRIEVVGLHGLVGPLVELLRVLLVIRAIGAGVAARDADGEQGETQDEHATARRTGHEHRTKGLS